MILKVFSNLNESMILKGYQVCEAGRMGNEKGACSLC